MEHDGPVALALTRQKLPELSGTGDEAKRGAYIVSDAEHPDALLLATGSEVQLALEAQETLKKEGIACRVVSMPSWEVFGKQDAEYQESVLPKEIRTRVAVEAAGTFGWERWTGADGVVIGMRTFGESGPAAEVFEKFGITAKTVAETVRTLVKG